MSNKIKLNFLSFKRKKIPMVVERAFVSGTSLAGGHHPMMK